MATLITHQKHIKNNHINEHIKFGSKLTSETYKYELKHNVIAYKIFRSNSSNYAEDSVCFHLKLSRSSSDTNSMSAIFGGEVWHSETKRKKSMPVTQKTLKYHIYSEVPQSPDVHLS